LHEMVDVGMDNWAGIHRRNFLINFSTFNIPKAWRKDKPDHSERQLISRANFLWQAYESMAFEGRLDWRLRPFVKHGEAIFDAMQHVVAENPKAAQILEEFKDFHRANLENMLSLPSTGSKRKGQALT